MSYNNLTWYLYDDAGLTTPSDISITVSCQTDLSDGYHDYAFYFGSTDTGQKLQAQSNPGVDSIILTPTYILPYRLPSTAYILGDSIIPATPNGYRYTCTTAGTSSSGTPTYGVTVGGTTTDGTVVWTLTAEDSPTTEIKLASTSGGLAGATAGAGLSLGATLLSGVSNAVQVHMRVTNTITQASSSVSTPELGVNINAIIQTAV